MKNASLLIHPDELSLTWIDRMVSHGLPTLALHPVGGREAKKSLEALLEQLEQPSFRALIDYAVQRGLRIEYEMHAMQFLLPRSEFSHHPQWFRMNQNGERTSDWNCCASNLQALDLIADHAAALVKKLYRSSHRYFLWLDDAKESACCCPECRRMTPSDQQLKILNHILIRLQKDDPEASLAYLAYYACIEAPKQLAPESGIFLEYAPFERDFHRPLSQDAQSRALTKLLSLFGAETAKALDYWYDNSLFSQWRKPPKAFTVDREVLQADFSYYREIGFEDIGCFACYLGKDYEDRYGAPDITDFAEAFHRA